MQSRTQLKLTKIAQRHIDQLSARWSPATVQTLVDRAREIAISQLHPQLGLANMDAALIALAQEQNGGKSYV